MTLSVRPRVEAFAFAMAVACFVACFSHELGQFPAESYRYRDDGVITLSHARNLVDYGFIGVSPSGERVEGFSSPLQFFLFVLAYATTHVGYRGFVDLQVWGSTTLMGALVYFGLRRTSASPWLALVGTGAVGALMVQSQPFLLWHFSGMENALVHVLLLACMVVASGKDVVGRLSLHPAFKWFAVALMLGAALSRFEFIVHVLPSALLFAYWRQQDTRRRDGYLMVAAMLGAFGLWYAWRSWYFSSGVPNTGAAQGISIARNVSRLVHGDSPYVRLLPVVLHRNHGLLLFPLVPLVVVTFRSKTARRIGVLGVLFGAQVVLHVLVFGPARLDAGRTTSFLAVTSTYALGVCLAALKWKPLRWGFLLLPLFGPVRRSILVECPSICCGAFEDQVVALRAATAPLGLRRPTVATFDLGAVSFTKAWNVLDLGALGSTPIGRGDPSTSVYVAREYTIQVAQPDVILLHSGWINGYRSMLQDQRFISMYSKSYSTPARTVWVRKDMQPGAGSAERRLVDDLQARFSVKRVADEVDDCAASSTSNCLYIARSVYRVLPELSQQQVTESIAAIERLPNEEQRTLSVGLVRSRERTQFAPLVLRYLKYKRGML